MKKAAIIFAVALLAAIALNSCTDDACPTYTQVDSSQAEKVV